MSTRLEDQLVDLAGRLDLADERLVDDILSRLDAPVAPLRGLRAARFESRGRRRLAVVGLVAAAALAVVFVLPSPRRTVAHWFGIGSVRIEGPPITLPPPASAPASTGESTPAPTSAPISAQTSPQTSAQTSASIAPPVTFPSSLDLGDAVASAEATSRTGLPTPLAPTLGAPTGIYVVSPPESGQIVVVYPPAANLPVSPVAGVGALLSTLPGTVEKGLFGKMLGEGTTVDTLTLTTASGAVVDAIWVAGEPHEYFFIDRNDQPVRDTLRLATHTLVWEVDGVTYRLEADISRAAAVDIAQSVLPG